MSDDPASDEHALHAAIDETRATLPDEDRSGVSDRAAYRWLATGMRLGLEHPRQALRMLRLIETGAADRSALDEGPVAGDASAAGAESAEPGTSEGIPVCSMLLARAASAPGSDRASEGSASRFDWAARLTRGEVLSMGRVVDDMLAAGSSPDVARGFGIAWDAGVRLPRRERNALLAQFTELELTVGEVLAGRDLRSDQRPPRTGLGALFSSWLTPPGQVASEAPAVIERSGEEAKRGLVALWNAWVAMSFRALIPRPTFELLVQPWVTVVGPLPEP